MLYACRFSVLFAIYPLPYAPACLASTSRKEGVVLVDFSSIADNLNRDLATPYGAARTAIVSPMLLNETLYRISQFGIATFVNETFFVSP